MNPYVEYAKNHFSSHPLSYGYEDIHSLIGMLCQLYRTYNPIGAECIDRKFALLEPDLRSLSRKRVRHIRHIMEEMCTEHEQEAFLAGIRVGIQLASELTEQ